MVIKVLKTTAKVMRQGSVVVQCERLNPAPEPWKPRVRPGYTWENVYIPPAPSLSSSASSPDSESLPCWQIHQHEMTSVTQPRREIQSQICHTSPQRREITSHAGHEPHQRREIASEAKRSDTSRVTRSPEPEVTSQPKFPVWEIYRAAGLSPPRKSVQPQQKWTSTVRLTSTRTLKNNLDFFTHHFKSPGVAASIAKGAGPKSPDESKKTVSPAQRPQSVPKSRGTQTVAPRARHVTSRPSKVPNSPRARYLTSGPSKVPNSPRERHVISGPSKVPNSPRQDGQRYPSLITQKPKTSVMATRQQEQPEPPSRPKPTITPSSWRTELQAHKLRKTAKQQKETNIPEAEKKSDDYSDDFESDKENELENKDKEPVAMKKTVRWKPRIVQPAPPPETPRPKERHYDPASVQRFINMKKQQRASQCKEEHKVHEITAKQRAVHLKALHDRARQLVAANVKRNKQGSTAKNGNAKITPVYLQPSSTRPTVKPASPKKPTSASPKFPRKSHKFDDKFWAWFTSLHEPTPPRPVILSEVIKQAKLEAKLRRAKERQEQQMTVNTATISPSKVDQERLTAPVNSSSAPLLQNPVSCLQAETAATKIQAVFRGYKTRKSLKRKPKPKEIKVAAVKRPVAFTVPFESWVQKSDADPFNFIQSVKRKLSEATKRDAIIQVTPNELESNTKPPQEEEKYESDFESYELSLSPSEEIRIGSDSQAASQHSLASVTPARSEDLCLQASRSQSSSTLSQNLVAPSIALLLHDKKPESSDSTLSKVSSQSSESEASKSDSSRNMVSPLTLPKPSIDLFTQQRPPILNIDFTTQTTVTSPKISTARESFKKFDLQQNIRIEDSSALSVSDTNIKELEMSIEAGFGRLTEEINAEQRRPAPLDDAQFLVPDVHIFPKFESTSVKPSQLMFEPPRKMSPENEDYSSQQSQSSTTETIEDEVEPYSEANSGGLPRVVEAAAELQRSIQCAKGNLQQVAEHTSLEEISEHVSIQYSSKFEEIASEEAGSAKSAFSTNTPTASEISTEALAPLFQDERGRTKSKEKLRSSSDRDSQRQGTSSSEQDSFTVFSLAMFQQLVRDQELRARHQRALLKQREDAIFEKSKAELILLENQKRQLRSSGMESSIPGIKKRQRAILMRLNQERDEIKRLRESHKMASQERRLMLQQQQHIAKMRIAARELSSKLQDKDLPITVNLKSQRLLEQPRRPRLAPSEEESSAASLSLDTSDLLLPKLAKQQVLESDQDSLPNTEILAKVVDTEEISAQQSNLQDRSTSPLPPTDEVFSEPCANEVEEVISRDVTSELTKPSETTIEVDSKLIKEQVPASTVEQPKVIAIKAPVTIKIPLSPRLQGRQKRRHSKTASEQSDVESRICALQEQLRRRKLEADRLRREQKRCHRERLRAKEQSLLKQIQAYDSYIQEARRELEQEFELGLANAGAVKPQIKQPRVAEKIMRRSESSEPNASEPKISEPIKSVEPKTASEQSDVESRICALQEQLRRRKLEADRLRREQKRCHRERLRAKEQSLLKQIQAYDSYIQEARRELEQEFELGLANAGAVKPQIKQPRVAEKIMRRSESSEPNASEPKISEPIKSVEPSAKSVSLNIVEEQQVPLNEISTGSDATSVPTDSSVQEIVDAVKSESDVESQDNQSLFDHLSIAQNQSITEDLESIVSRKESIVEALESCDIIDDETSKVVATYETSPQRDSEEIVEEVDVSSEKDVERSVEIQSENVPVDETQEKDEYSSEFFSPENVTTSAATQKDEEMEVETAVNIHLEGDKSPESPESYSADSSVETTIESPRRPLVDSEAKQEHSDEDISENLQEDLSQGDEKEDETARITSYLFQLLLSETMQCTCKQIEVKKEVATDQRCTEVDRIAENISKNLLDEALAQLFPIYKQRMTKLTEEKTESSTTHSILERRDSEEIVEEVDVSSEKDVERSVEIQSENVPVDETQEKDEYSSEFFSPENVTTSAATQKDEEMEVETAVNIHLEGDKSPESPESYSADSSVETTIESPRRPLVDSEAKQEHSDEDISENLQEDLSQGDEKEDETTRITSYLFQLLLSETMQCTCKQIEVKKEVATDQRCTEVDRIAENISKNLLDEALAQLFPIYKQRMTKLTEEKTESSTTHSILERVHTLLAETEASPAREAPRPQDLMMTTYIEEILSPEPDECADLAKDIVDHPEVPNDEVTEEKVELIKEEGPRCDDVTEAQIQQPADAAATGDADEDKNEGDEATAQLQDWFDEDFGLSSTRREAEELRLQQLQIEQEIEQLQAQQYPYYYVREIPNKPPPPYTPPGEIPKSPDEAEEIPGAVPSSKEQVLPLVSRAVETLYHARLAGRDLETVQAAWTPGTEEESEACVAYKQFIFDLCKELLQEAYCCSDKESPPWLEPPAVHKRKKLLMPKSLENLQNRVEEKVMGLLGFSTRVRREKLIIRWSRKRRDHVDELLVREAQEEEQAWTNYELDEAAVKSQISDAIMNMLLTETATAVEKTVASKAQKLEAQSENQIETIVAGSMIRNNRVVHPEIVTVDGVEAPADAGSYIRHPTAKHSRAVELIKEEGPRCDDVTEAQIQQPADAAATGDADEDKNEGDEATAQLQDWFDEDFGLSSTRREAEELRLQQLQIEQEIEQLQAQQYPYYYVREIPNKPPPPYTPPGEIPKSPDEAEEIPGAVPSSKEQVLPLVSRAVETLYHARLAGRDLETVQAAWTPGAEEESEACVAYKQFIFDLCKELLQEAYCCSDKESPPWLEPPAVHKRKKLLMPKSLENLQNRVEEKVMGLLGFSTRVRREKLIIRWSRKRRDHVDELLVREAQEEEQAWTNYELDEAAVKSQISDAIMNMLLTETATAVEKTVASKAQKLEAQSENQS
ncbi:hypothetical protein B566_EDAN002970 [Ephemera danica]|nr:hypothetical protein B566_EDAN002970 [Ephemera danica]